MQPNKLQSYQERSEQAQEAGHIGIFEWDLVTNKLWWSKEEIKLFGREEFGGDPVTDWVKTVHPEDVERVRAEVAEAIQKKQSIDTQFRVIYPDQSVHWLKERAHIKTDGKKVVKIIGVNYEITDQIHLEQSLRFLANASEILATSLDYQTTLNSIALSAIPDIADWCSVEIMNDGGGVEQVALIYNDRKKAPLAKLWRSVMPINLASPRGVGKVFRTGESEFYPYISEELVLKSAKNEKELKMLQKIQLTAVIIVPLKNKGQTIGTISLVSAESKRRYTQIDLEIAEQLASKASLAIENARLYRDVENERERLNNLVGNVPGVVWEAYGQPDLASQQIDFVSAHVERMLGYSQQEWLETSNFWLTIVHPEDKVQAAKDALDKFESGVGGISRFRWLTKKGQVLWVEAHSYVIKDANGVPIGMRGVTMDISERVELEKRKDEFISTASHELKTPVTTIKSYTQILQHFFQAETQAQYYLAKMDSQVDRLTSLVNDLLDVSKIQSGKLEMQIDTFWLDNLVTDIVEDLQQTTPQHVIKVQLQAEIKIQADKYRISQVVINLLSNAIKYSPKADTIIVTVKQVKDEAWVSIQDFGIGISKSNLSKIFDRFFQANNQIRPSFSGLGLGLYISSEITKRHGGTIEVQSEKKKGSIFTLKLPLISNHNSL